MISVNCLNDQPLISLLMPVYNAERYLAEAIRSVLTQTYTNFELLIADDASTDNSRQVMHRCQDARIRFFYNEKNFGYLKSCNLLFEHARGAIIGFHDADDMAHSKRLEEQLKLVLGNERTFCGCNIRYMNQDGKLLDVVMDKSTFVTDNYPRIGDSTLLIHRTQIEKVGGLYRPHFSNNQDYDLGLRLLDCFEYRNLNYAYYYYRNVPYSNSKDYSRPEKVINGDLVRMLAEERRGSGTDALMTNEMERFQALKSRLLAEYETDKTMVERRAISYLLSIKMYGYALRLALRAVKKDPTNPIVYRSLFYVVRKFLKDRLLGIARLNQRTLIW